MRRPRSEDDAQTIPRIITVTGLLNICLPALAAHIATKRELHHAADASATKLKVAFNSGHASPSVTQPPTGIPCSRGHNHGTLSGSINCTSHYSMFVCFIVLHEVNLRSHRNVHGLLANYCQLHITCTSIEWCLRYLSLP